MSNETAAVAHALNAFADSLEPAQNEAQAESCEEALLRKLGGLGQKLALQAADEITGMVRDYLACRFGAAPQAAPEGLGDQIGAIIRECAIGNLRLFLTGGWQAYAAAVARCAAGKLLGGLTGGALSPASGFAPHPTGRCGH